MEAAVKQAGKGALIGAGLGALGGLVGGVVYEFLDVFDTREAKIGESVVGGAVAGSVTGLAAGALQGAVVGEPHWEAVSLDQLRTILCRQRGGEDYQMPTPVSAGSQAGLCTG